MQEPIPEKLQRAIVKLYKSSWGTYNEIAEPLEVSRKTVERVLREDRTNKPL